jgi:hypothetical protein
MKYATVVMVVCGLCGNSFAQDSIAKEMLDRQLQVIEETPAAAPVILRLDEDLEELLNRAQELPDSKRVKFVADGLSPQRNLYALFGMPDLNEFARYLLGRVRYPKVNLHRNGLAGRALSAEIRRAYQKCAQAYGRPLSKAPLYKVAFGYQHATNAKTQGIDRRIDRAIVVLNRSALSQDRLWDAAIIHETWHCFQSSTRPRTTLLQRAIHEGVVTHLTQMIDPTLDDRAVLLWSDDQWKAASERREAIIKSFAANRDSTDPNVINSYLVLGKPLDRVPGAPSRCGYFVGLLAVRAWQQAHPDSGPAELIETSAADIWQSLPMERTP